MTVQTADDRAPKAGFSLYDPKLRGIVYQVVMLVALVALVWTASSYAVANMARLGIPLNFNFWNQTAGFDINQTLVSYSALSTYGQAFWVGLYNTLLVGAFGVVLATVIGFVVAVLRLSPNWIVSKLATVYVELFRNIPLLLQLIFWYSVVLKSLPSPKQSISVFGAVFLNTRGIVVPNPVMRDGAGWVGWAFLAGIVLSIAFSVVRASASGRHGRAAPRALGQPRPDPRPARCSRSSCSACPSASSSPCCAASTSRAAASCSPSSPPCCSACRSTPAPSSRRSCGPASWRSAAASTRPPAPSGIRSNVTMRLVVIPQAMRVIVPPLTNQYLNLIKNSSLAVFIGYPDLVQVFAGTVLNQTGAAIQCMALTMLVYLVISLVLSGAMNVYNKRVALVER